MRQKYLFRLPLLLMLMLMVLLSGCYKNPAGPAVQKKPAINEAAVAAEYVEKQITFKKLMDNVLDADDLIGEVEDRPQSVLVIDIRTPEEFAAGHIKNAVNLRTSDITAYYDKNDLSKKKFVVIASASGQKGRYVQGLLRMAGYENIYLLKWGMSSWNTEVAKNNWLAAIGNTYADKFSQTPEKRNEPGALPVINTGKTDAQEILKARAFALLADDKAFDKVLIQPADVFANLDKLYIVNYWPKPAYMEGHIPGAVQYTISPESDLGISKALNTLPTNKTVAVYCFTGQTSALMASYLQVLGYDVKSIAYGVNAMNHNMLKANKFSKSQISEYGLVK